MMKNLSETAFHKVYKTSSHSKTLKLSVFLRESGDFLYGHQNHLNVVVFHKFSLNDEIMFKQPNVNKMKQTGWYSNKLTLFTRKETTCMLY